VALKQNKHLLYYSVSDCTSVLKQATAKQTRIPNWIRSVNVTTATSFSLKTAQ